MAGNNDGRERKDKPVAPSLPLVPASPQFGDVARARVGDSFLESASRIRQAVLMPIGTVTSLQGGAHLTFTVNEALAEMEKEYRVLRMLLQTRPRDPAIDAELAELRDENAKLQGRSVTFFSS